MYSEEPQMHEIQQNPPRNVVMGIIIFLSVMGVAVASLSLIRNVRSPFFTGSANQASVATLDTTDQAQAAQRTQALKNQDSDGDGLSDFDELYVYKTSPYLKDTDSDGFDDKTEIATNHDPNCPEGKSCTGEDLAKKPTTSGTVISQLPGVSNNTVPGSTALDQALVGGGDPTPEQIRTLMKQKGMTDEQLSQFDDQTLLQMYQDSLATAKQQQNTSGTPTNTTTTNTPTSTTTDYSQLTAQQIRDLAVSSGLVTADQLSKIDDATLKDLFLKTLKANPPQ